MTTHANAKLGLPERSQWERTRREDRRLKFYELWDMLGLGRCGGWRVR